RATEELAERSELDKPRRRRHRVLAAAICLVGLGGAVAWVAANANGPPPRLVLCMGAVTNSSGATPTEALLAYLRAEPPRGRQALEGNDTTWKLVDRAKGSAAFETSHSRIEVVKD